MIKVYHGAIQEVSAPLVHVGRENLDFGKGFYTSLTLTRPSKSFVIRSLKGTTVSGSTL